MAQLLDSIFPAQRGRAVRLGLCIDQRDWEMTAGVFGTLSRLVGPEPLLNVGGNARVERTVTAGEYIDVVHGAPQRKSAGIPALLR